MQRCSKKAYAMCPTRHLCGSIEEAIFSEDSECAAFNRTVEDKPMSNGDRIRAMSDEQLCQLFMEPVPCVFLDCSCSPFECQECTMRWLQQPAD